MEKLVVSEMEAFFVADLEKNGEFTIFERDVIVDGVSYRGWLNFGPSGDVYLIFDCSDGSKYVVVEPLASV